MASASETAAPGTAAAATTTPTALSILEQVTAAPDTASGTWGTKVGPAFSVFAHGIIGVPLNVLVAVNALVGWLGALWPAAKTALQLVLAQLPGQYVMYAAVYRWQFCAVILDATQPVSFGASRLTKGAGSVPIIGPLTGVVATIGPEGQMGTATVDGSGVAHLCGELAVDVGGYTEAQIIAAAAAG